MNREHLRRKILLAASAVILALAACSRPNQPSANNTGNPNPPRTPPKSTLVKLPPPTVQDVRNVVARAFAGTIEPSNRTRPRFAIGDFNGDGSDDIAVVVRPVPAKLKDINSASANWVVWDPTSVPLPKRGQALVRLDAKIKAEHVQRSDLLLAIIHGSGPNGWRDPQAYQVFLLRGLADNNPKAERLTTRLPFQPQPEDVIPAMARVGQGYVYWIGTVYAWQSRATVARMQVTPPTGSRTSRTRS